MAQLTIKTDEFSPMTFQEKMLLLKHGGTFETKARANLTFDLENLHQELVGMVKQGEIFVGEIRPDKFFYFKTTDVNGNAAECRLPVGANGVEIV